MPFNYNTQGITNPDANDPRNLGGSEGYGNPTASGSSGIMSSTANTTSNDDDNEPSFFESIANLFSGAGADLPSDNNDDGDSGVSFYSGPMFGPFNNGSDDSGSDNNSSSTSPLNKPLPTSATDRALYEALNIDVPEVYRGELGEWEPEPNINVDVLQKALQPDPITVEEIEVKAGDTLSDIAKDKGVPVQDVINANPQIKNPDLIRPGEKVTVPETFTGIAPEDFGTAAKVKAPEVLSIPEALSYMGDKRGELIMKGIDKLFGMFPPKTEEEKAAKSELEYFLDAQPDSVLPSLFKYIPDAVQVQEYLKGREDRKMEGLARESAELAASERDAAGITRSLTPEEVKQRNAALKAASEDPDSKFYQSTIPIEDRTFPAEADTGEGLMSPTNLSSRLDTKGETPKSGTAPTPNDAGIMTRRLTAEERAALSDRGPSWQKSQGLPIYKDGSFDKPTMESSLEGAGLVGKEAALLKGAVKTEVGTDGPRTENPYSIRNLASGTGNFKTGGRWDTELKRHGLLNADGEVTQIARDLNRQGRLSDTILDAVYAGGRLGNGDFASGDGSRYKGRGLIQITGRNNYQAVQDRLAETGLSIDLMANPELVNDERYALPATLAMMDILGVNSSSADSMSAKTLNNAINSGADRATAQERWENVLNAASPAERAALELRDEYAAQVEVGLTGTDVDGDIGTGTKLAIDTWAASKGLTPPAVTPITKVSNRTGRSYQTYSPEDKLKLAIFVNDNS